MVQQEVLQPGVRLQPFISPPMVAFAVAPLAWLPYDTAYIVWAVVMFGAFAAALAFSSVSNGLARWIAVLRALSPVVGDARRERRPDRSRWLLPAWSPAGACPGPARRARRHRAGGHAAQTEYSGAGSRRAAFVGRYRAAAWAVCAVVALIAAVAVLGPTGRRLCQRVAQSVAERRRQSDAVSAPSQRQDCLPPRSASSSWRRARERIQASPVTWPADPLAIIGSLLVSPYLHGADLGICRRRLDDVGGARLDRVAGAARRRVVHRQPLPLSARRQPRADAVAVARAHLAVGLAGGRVATLNRVGCLEEAGSPHNQVARRLSGRLVPLDISEIQGPLRVLAGPGTGKTHALVDSTRRPLAIARLDAIRSWCSPSRLGAAAEIARRIDAGA